MDYEIIYFLYILILVFGITNAAVNKIYFYKFDPLLFITLHSSLVVSAVLYESDKIESKLVLLIIVMHIFFIIGLRSTHFITKNSLSKIGKHNKLKIINDSSLISLMMFFCFLYSIYVVCIWLNFGLLIMSEDPEAYKLQFSSGGYGFIFRTMSSIILPLFFFIVLSWGKLKWRLRIIPIAAMLLALASTGKSVLILLIIIGLISITYRIVILRETVYIDYRKIILVSLIALSFVLFILYLSYGDAVNSNGQLIFLSFFLERISTASGLGLVTYLQNIHYFDGILKGDIFTYIWNYLVVPLAAPLRLVEYVPTAGRELGIFITGGEEYGPNPTSYAEGLIYFGYIFCSFYTFAIGLLINILRSLAIISSALFSPTIGALLFVYVYYSLLAITTDYLVFMSLITSYTFFMILFITLLKTHTLIKFSLK